MDYARRLQLPVWAFSVHQAFADLTNIMSIAGTILKLNYLCKTSEFLSGKLHFVNFSSAVRVAQTFGETVGVPLRPNWIQTRSHEQLRCAFAFSMGAAARLVLRRGLRRIPLAGDAHVARAARHGALVSADARRSDRAQELGRGARKRPATGPRPAQSHATWRPPQLLAAEHGTRWI